MEGLQGERFVRVRKIFGVTESEKLQGHSADSGLFSIFPQKESIMGVESYPPSGTTYSFGTRERLQGLFFYPDYLGKKMSPQPGPIKEIGPEIIIYPG